VVVRDRVAEVDGRRAAAVGGQQRRQPGLDLGPRLVERRRHQLTAAAHQRRGQAVGIVVQLAERHALGADEPGAQDVVGVAADAQDLGPVGGDREPAGGLAQRAGPERDSGHVPILGRARQTPLERRFPRTAA
jgi:hypothetical protein